MATRKSTDEEKLTEQVNVRFPSELRRALSHLAELEGVSDGELLRRLVDREWSARAEDLKAFREFMGKLRKKRAA